MRRAMVVVLVVAAAAAAAMSIREHSRSLGKSGDHKSELFEDVSDGPEGGGSISYRLTGDEVLQTFLLSSDFSPGNGSRPQTVPEKLCRERLTALAALLKARGFQGLAVHPEVCAQKARAGAVSR